MTMLRAFLRRASVRTPSSWAARSCVPSVRRPPLLSIHPSSAPLYPPTQHLGFSSSSSQQQPEGFLSLWNRRIEEGSLRPDKAQQRIAKRLYRLQEALAGYSNEAFFILHERQQQKLKEEQEKDAAEKAKEEEEMKNEGRTTKNVAKQGKMDPALSTDNNHTNDEDSQVSETATVDDPPPPPPLPRIPRGLYIHGPVGTGKSLLMDTFYNSIMIDDDKKQRLHFHAFMADVHSRIHRLNQDDLKAKGRNFSIDTSYNHNPIVRVALQLSRSTTLLCLDEFQVTDVADAMILKQLFEVLFAFGTIVLATSNRPPQDLYEGGLNRSYFEPFIDMVEQHCIVHSLESTVGDYRKMLAAEEHKIQPPPSSDESAATQNTSQSQSNAAMARSLPNNGKFFFCHSQDSKLAERIVQDLWTMVYSSTSINTLESFDLPAGFGRRLTVSRGDKQGLVGVFSFEELCHGDLGASDYRALAQQFSVVVLEAVPQLTTFQHNRARRFITLIDELYEGKCALVCSTLPAEKGEADVITFDTLFESIGGDGNPFVEGASVKVGETLGLEDVQTQGGQPVSTLASVRELSFAFRRAASRMTEMTSPRWWYQVLDADGWLEKE